VKTIRNLLALNVALLVVLGGPARAQDTGTPDTSQVVEQPKPYSPYVDQHFPDRVLFGDTHHHTSLSVDCGIIGNNNDPEVGPWISWWLRTTRNISASPNFLLKPTPPCWQPKPGKSGMSK
jgi:hypothetical protein